MADITSQPGHQPFDRESASTRLLAGFPLVDGHPDVAGVLRDPELLRLLGPALSAPFIDAGVTVVCAPEARGPILGALVAYQLGVGLVLARKDERNHPGADMRTVSQPTWRGTPETFLTRSFDFEPDDRVLVVDDWITSGSSIAAVRQAVVAIGAAYVGASVLVNKASDSTLAELAVRWLVGFDDLMRA
jgi:adenine/guanine phosphoribosyltransferase-like PRPP-binding protein